MKIGEFGLKEIGFFALVFALLTAIFYFGPDIGRRDWRVVNAGLVRFVSGEEVYQPEYYDDIPHVYYLPPWFTVLFSPLAFLPNKFNWALLSTTSIFALLILSRHYKLGWVKTLIFFLSPPVPYNFIQANMDIILLLTVLMPYEFWPLIAATKPHVIGGLPFALFHRREVWLRTIILTSIVLTLSFVFFGWWPLKILEMSNLADLGETGHNQLKGLYPLQLVVAVGLLAVGFERKDERYFLSASPFFLSYTTIGNFVGLALVLVSSLKWWQSLAIMVTWWIVLRLA